MERFDHWRFRRREPEWRRENDEEMARREYERDPSAEMDRERSREREYDPYDPRRRYRGYEPDYAQGFWPRYEPEPRRGYGPYGSQFENYTGRGPNGYRRSDERIYEEINDRLTDHPGIDATDIEVVVVNCQVTLSGRVRSRDQKRMATDVAELTPGVRDVHNRIQVEPRELSDRDRERDRDWNRESRERSARAGETTMPAQAQEMRLLPGMIVLDRMGEKIGEVKDVKTNSFHLDRPMKRDLFVPLSAVREVIGNNVHLQQRAEEIDHQGWESPELIGLGSKRRS